MLKWLGLIVAAALLVRVAWGMRQGDRVDSGLPDQREYLEMAQNLLAGRGLEFQDTRWHETVYAARPPGYPLFLAACGADVRLARVAQAALDASTVLAAYLLARRWLSPGASLWAAALLAVNPFLIYFSALILTETLFTAMLAWGLALLLRNRPGPRAAGAILLAASVLVRPSAILLPILLAAAAAVADRRRPLLAAAAMFALTVAALFPWALRNHARLGVWVWTTTNGGITAYDGFHDHATGASDQALLDIPPRLGEIERDQYCRWRAVQWIQEHPLGAAELAVVKIARTWSPLPLSGAYGRPAYRAAALLYTVPLDLLALWGLLSRRLPASAKTMLLLPALYFTTVHALSVGSLRYRMPVEPMLAILAACALCERQSPDPEPRTPNPEP